MKVIMSMERNTEQALSSGQMGLCILENFITIIFMVRVCILGVMAENTKENGRIIKCMVKVPLPGQMVENMSANMWMIKNKGMENLYGQMEDHIKVTG